MNKLEWFFATAWRALSWYIIAIVGVLLMLFACDPALSREACQTKTLEWRLDFLESYLGGRDATYFTEIVEEGETVKNLYLLMKNESGYQAAVITFVRDCQLPLPLRLLDPEKTAQDIFGKTLAEMFLIGTEV